MIDIKKLDMNDIISICRIIGLEEINRFMKENHISSRMVTGKTMLGYSQKGSAPFPMAFAVMYDRSRNDKQVIAFFEDKIKSIILGIRKNIAEKIAITSEAYLGIISEINSIFDGNEALFCKIAEVENLMEYVDMINDDKTNKIETGTTENNTTVSLCSRMQIAVPNLKKADFEQLIEVIGASTLSKVIPGMWISSHSESKIQNYLYNNRNEKTVCSFIKSRVDEILKTVSIRFTYYYESYNNIETATILSLYESPFKNNPKLYYKLTRQNSNAQIFYQLNALAKLPNNVSELINVDKKTNTEELNEKIAYLEDIIRLSNEKTEQQKDEYEAKIADLEKSKKEADEALIAAEAEIANLLKVNKEYEEKAAVNDEVTILSYEKEALISEIKQLEDRKEELLDEVKVIEEHNTQLISQKTQLQNSLDNEIKRFSNDFVHSTAITALLKQVNHNGSVSGRTIFIDVPEPSTINASNENKLLTVTEILAENLFSAGMQKHNDILAKMILPTLLCKGCFIVYGNEQSNVADAISLAIYAEYAAHVVLPMDISDIPYFIEEISKISRNVIYIENALDTYTDRLCSALIKYCKGKIFVFAANDYDSLKRLKGSSVFEKCLYLNTEFFSGYLAKPEYKVNSCNLAAYQEKADVYDSLIKKDYVTQLFRLFNIPPSVSRFWTRITAVHCNIYNTLLRKSIIIELIMTLMIKDSLCSGSYNKIHDYINENEDTKLDLLDGIVAEDMNNESNN